MFRPLVAAVMTVVALVASASPVWACLCQPVGSVHPCCVQKPVRGHVVDLPARRCCCSVDSHAGPSASAPVAALDSSGNPELVPLLTVNVLPVLAAPAPAGRSVAWARATGPPEVRLLSKVRLRP